MEDRILLESLPEKLNRHELALARVRLKTCLNKQLGASPEDWLTYERAIARYLGLIVSSIHKNASLKDYGALMDSDIRNLIRRLNKVQNDS